MMRIKAINLRDKIIENREYLFENYQPTCDILYDLNKIITLQMSNSMIFQWQVENENSIEEINRLLEMIEEK